MWTLKSFVDLQDMTSLETYNPGQRWSSLEDCTRPQIHRQKKGMGGKKIRLASQTSIVGEPQLSAAGDERQRQFCAARSRRLLCRFSLS